MNNINKAIFSAILVFILSMHNVKANENKNAAQCSIAKLSASEFFNFEIDLDLEDLQSIDLDDADEKQKLEEALLDYYNEAVTCACEDFDIVYTKVTISPAPTPQPTLRPTLQPTPPPVRSPIPPRRPIYPPGPYCGNYRMGWWSIPHCQNNGVDRGSQRPPEPGIYHGVRRNLQETRVTRVHHNAEGTCSNPKGYKTYCPKTPVPETKDIAYRNKKGFPPRFLSSTSTCGNDLFVETLGSRSIRTGRIAPSSTYIRGFPGAYVASGVSGGLGSSCSNCNRPIPLI